MKASEIEGHTLLPLDLFYSHIIPDILSEHIHQILCDGAKPEWHPFYTLPLVSRSFYTLCKRMYTNIFGLENNDDTSKIVNILSFAHDSWTRARLPLGSHPGPILNPNTYCPYTYGQLMSSKSVIQIYICTAIAHSFFKSDVLWSLELDTRGVYQEDLAPHRSEQRRSVRMDDETMHRVYLPLLCALKLCDSIRPSRLAFTIAQHLADITPRYSTEPVLLKCAQDLETYISRQHRVDMNTWIEWTSRTLGLIEDTEGLLKKMQRMGKLVKTFRRSSSIPWEVIKETGIINALRAIMIMDWGPDTNIIRGRAADLFEEWSLILIEY